MPALRAAGDTHIGKVREANEDRFIVDPQLGLYAVLDGMGGRAAGAVAAQLAGDTIREVVGGRRKQLAPRDLLTQAISAASNKVYAASTERTEYERMGTTVVASLVVGAHIVIAHVGDSRAYLLSGHRFERLTRDHTAAEELVDLGMLHPDDVDHSVVRNVLSRHVGAPFGVVCDVVELELLPGDRVLLCSDGLHGAASPADMRRVLFGGEPLERTTRALIELALQRGGPDNITAVVLASEGL